MRERKIHQQERITSISLEVERKDSIVKDLLLPFLLPLSVAIISSCFIYTSKIGWERDYSLLILAGSFYLSCLPGAMLSSHWTGDILVFSLFSSILLPAADWTLVTGVKSLQFSPSLFIPSLNGTMPIVFCFFWGIPVYLGLQLSQYSRGYFTSEAIPCLISVLMIGGGVILSEFPASVINLWRPTSKVRHRWGGVALYVIPPEVILGLASHVAYSLVRGKSVWKKAVAAFAVSLIYTGAMNISFNLFEYA